MKYLIQSVFAVALVSGTLVIAGCSASQAHAADKTSQVATMAMTQSPATPTPPSFAPYAGPDKILVADAAKKSVTVHLVAAEGKVANGMNFNGFANGNMQVQVPTGWKVRISLTVGGGALAHSALIVPWTEKDKAGHWGLAFPKAAVADYAAGMEAGDAPQTFKIVADKPGQYGLICGVPGHVAMGMWDEFDVVDALAAPQVLVKG